MIPRYSRPEMVAIWSPETKFRIWFEIEAHACDALAEIGVIPKEAAKTIWEKGGAATFDVDRIDETHIIVGNDNNLPFSAGRALDKADDNEFVLIEAGDLLKAE